MKRLYYLTSTLDSTEQISRHMQREGISDWFFHVISKDEAGLYRRHIHSGTLLQKLDFLRDWERGALLGLAAAIVVTLILVTFKPFGSDVGFFVHALIFVLIALFGGWVGGLVGMAHQNRSLHDFRSEIDAGKYLILLDVAKNQAERLKSVMAQAHPEAQLVRESRSFNPLA